VPDETLRAFPFQAGDLEQFPPHATKVLLALAVLPAEHVRAGLVA
jgi:hypothetical protein